MKKRMVKVFLMLVVFSCMFFVDLNVFATDLNVSESKTNTQLSISGELSREDFLRATSEKPKVIGNGEYLEKIIDFQEIIKGDRSSHSAVYEVEPNDSGSTADFLGYIGFGYTEREIYGTINHPTVDLDYFGFVPVTTGEVEIFGFWLGDYAGYGYEDDLIMILTDSNGNGLATSQRVEVDGYYASYLYYPYIPRDTVAYIIVLSNYNEILYNQNYGLAFMYQQTSRPLSMSLKSQPQKINYLYGEPISTEGAEFTIVFDDLSSGWDVVTPDMISGYDPEVLGIQLVTVTFENVSCTYQVVVDRFIDVPYGHRNYVHINALVGLGIINGYSDNTFRPNNTLTRAQAAIMIARAVGLSTDEVSSNFTDVPPTHAAYKFISAAYQAGIINGYSDGTFRPNAFVTRAQIAIMVQRAFNIQASGTNVSFTDVPEGYAPKKFIETLASQKIVNGYSDGTFKPLNNVTRAQFSTMIYNAIQYAKNQETE